MNIQPKRRRGLLYKETGKEYCVLKPKVQKNEGCAERIVLRFQPLDNPGLTNQRKKFLRDHGISVTSMLFFGSGLYRRPGVEIRYEAYAINRQVLHLRIVVRSDACNVDRWHQVIPSAWDEKALSGFLSNLIGQIFSIPGSNLLIDVPPVRGI